jgi:hypothetical protein
MSPDSPSQIQYLNTDLDLASERDLTELAAALTDDTVFPLSVTHGENGLWYATFEIEGDSPEPETTIRVLLTAIERLSPSLREAWNQCSLREFNIGYDCGQVPWAFNQGLSAELLGRMVAARTTLRITIYPERP